MNEKAKVNEKVGLTAIAICERLRECKQLDVMLLNVKPKHVYLKKTNNDVKWLSVSSCYSENGGIWWPSAGLHAITE